MTLIAAVTCQPEKLCAYYLDLYYQVRRAYEKEHEEPKVPPLTLEAAWPRLRELMEETLRSTAEDQARAILNGMGLLEKRADYPEPKRTMNTPETPSTAGDPFHRRTPPVGCADSSSKGRAGKEGQPPDSEKKLAALAAATKKSAAMDRSGERNGMAIAKKEKLAIRERLLDARRNGLHNPQLLQEANGKFSEDDLWKIINGEVVGIAVYREIGRALDRIEDKASISA